MPPRIASLVFLVGIAGFIWLDRDRKERTSPWIWIAVAWMFFGASRGPTLWLYGQTPDDLTQYVDGSPLDRLLFSALQLAATLVLVARAKRVWALLRGNVPVVVFFVYCALSIFWSDYPFVALKRWVKTFGNLTMVWLLLTDDEPVAAVKRFLARTGVLLIPLSVLFIKYYPDLGRSYSRWTWTPSFIGVATDKNGLGVLALVFGLGALWNFVEALREENPSVRLQRAIAHGGLAAMAVWLFPMANSSTSLACFLLGGAVVVSLSLARIERPVIVHVLVAAALAFGVFSYAFLDADTLVIQALGRDTSLTGRTELWGELLRFRINPWIGTGFETFWLGDRAQYFWDMYWWHPNQAHNGFLEMYLDLGWIGVGMVVMLIAAGYRNILGSYGEQPGFGRIRLALLLIACIYSITEAAFKLLNPMWVTFLMAATAVPVFKHASRAEVAQPDVAATGARRLPPVTLAPFKLKPPPPTRRAAFGRGE